MWQFEPKQIEWMNEGSVPGSWSCAGWCPPLAEALHDTGGFVSARVCVLCVYMCVCVMEQRERSECCWGDGESAQCSVEDWRLGTQCVLRQSLCISPSLSLSLCEYNPFHSLRGRAANEPALSLPLSPSTSLLFCISALHMSPEQKYPPRASTLQ